MHRIYAHTQLVLFEEIKRAFLFSLVLEVLCLVGVKFAQKWNLTWVARYPGEFFRAHTHIHRLVIFARPCEKVPFLRFPRPGVRGNVYDYCPDVSFRSPGSGVEVRGTRTWVRFMFM